MTDASDRSAALKAFLRRNRLGSARVEPLPGDASARRYLRLFPEGRPSLIVMDSPPEAGMPLGQFLRAGACLAEAGLSVPAVHDADEEAGFLLLEDFGDRLLSRLLETDAAEAEAAYLVAVEAIARLQARGDGRALPGRSSAERAAMALPALEVYAAAVSPLAPTLRDAFVDCLERPLAAHAPEIGVVVHRDCHADNLIWLPGRTGPARIGWLDFQDAERGHPAFDPVSLLCDVRRDLPEALVAGCRARFLTETGMAQDELAAAWATLGAQRNLRILGVFTRLARERGKRQYLRFLPRLWRQLRAHLEHPALGELRSFVADHVPAPTPAVIERLGTP